MSRATRMALFVSAALAACVALNPLFGNGRALAQSPPAAGLQMYVPAESIRFRRESEGGIPILVISGEIVNPHYEPRAVPPMVIILLDSGGRPLRSELVRMDNRMLDPAKRLPFQTSIPNAPPEASAVRIIFQPAN